MTNFELWYCDDLGNRLALINNVISFEYVKIVGDIGAFSLTVPVRGKLWESRIPDNRIHIYRQSIQGGLVLDFVGFCLSFEWITATSGLEQFVISGADQNVLVSRRINAYDTDAAGANYSDDAADAMRGTIRENLGGLTSSDRDWQSTAYFSIANNNNLGPTIQGSVAWQPVLDILQNMQTQSKTAGPECFWNIVPISDTVLEFRTYANQPGADKTGSVSFSTERGNLINPRLEYNYRDQKSYIYVGGKGQGAGRNIQEVEDTTRTNQSFWGRNEKFRNATYIPLDDTAALTDVGDQELARFRERIKLTAVLLDSPLTRYGKDWNLGDRVKIDYQGIQANTIIRSVHINLSPNGRETVTARAEIEV